MVNIKDHSEIAAVERDGYPSWTSPENQDCEEYRDKFIQENIKKFLDWMKHGDQDVLDRFFEEHSVGYKNFLN